MAGLGVCMTKKCSCYSVLMRDKWSPSVLGFGFFFPLIVFKQKSVIPSPVKNLIKMRTFEFKRNQIHKNPLLNHCRGLQFPVPYGQGRTLWKF